MSRPPSRVPAHRVPAHSVPIAQVAKPMLKPIRKSAKLSDVCYDIRGPVMARAKQMEE